jgi:hypothetical protein
MRYLSTYKLFESVNNLFTTNEYKLERDLLYHGTSRENLLSILENGVWGQPHRELDESETLSVSFNDNMIRLFSEDNCGLVFQVSGSIFKIPEWLMVAMTIAPGSGAFMDMDEEIALGKCREYGVPLIKYGSDIVPEHNFISNNMPKDYIGASYEYVLDNLQGLHHNDESEVIIMGKGLQLLNNSIITVYIDGEEYDVEEAKNFLSASE